MTPTYVDSSMRYSNAGDLISRILRMGHISAPVVAGCDDGGSSSMDPYFHVAFDMQMPAGNYAREQRLVATARRCMHELCWFPPARAYALGLYADVASLNRIKTYEQTPDSVAASTFDMHTPKTFVLRFSSEKDICHIRNGFGKSLERYLLSQGVSDPQPLCRMFLSSLEGISKTAKGDTLRIFCDPQKVVIQYNVRDPVTIIAGADILTAWMHWMYLGVGGDVASRDVKYPTMQKQIKASTPVYNVNS